MQAGQRGKVGSNARLVMLLLRVHDINNYSFQTLSISFYLWKERVGDFGDGGGLDAVCGLVSGIVGHELDKLRRWGSPVLGGGVP